MFGIATNAYNQIILITMNESAIFQIFIIAHLGPNLLRFDLETLNLT